MSKASKRANRLASMFGQVDPEALAQQAAIERPGNKGMTTAPTKALQASFASIERDNIKLRQELDKSVSKDLDPDQVLPSLIQDRMDWNENDPEFQQLLSSIEAYGQKLPILVRPHPELKGSYQLAYGARRNRACKVLGRQVRAYVEDLTDEQLVIAQGVENNERKNLSFIEQALYAQALAGAGYSRKVIAECVGVGNETIISKMTAIIAQIPLEIFQLIGPAPKIGRTRWEALGEFIGAGENKDTILYSVKNLSDKMDWQRADSNKRFDLALRIAENADQPKAARLKALKAPLTSGPRTFGSIEKSYASVKITINAKSEPAFAKFMSEKMSALINEFEDQERVMKKMRF
ncbi:MAG: plasmid partitioning protein RepB [Roseibium sp.]|uniref:plasmid partitioning protein RepB n=1 Tax=Roseibium sp. TaxID=1936156 RepID=UPI0026189FBC|nr:plasmid partitioning protein RepB [Roseibium sp.]MCV0428161.1 plasmid partitioning protein RepB [Roseibium sp.]